MPILSSLITFSTAGAINGSFALPSKQLHQWSFQRIWLNYSVWAFLVFPVLFLTAMSPIAWKMYMQTSFYLLNIILIGGFLFGIGQICFSRALQLIGMGLSFVINISIGTVLGSFIPLVLFHAKQLTTPSGIMTLLGIALIVVGVILSYMAGVKRDCKNDRSFSKKNFYLGTLCAALAGLFSAGQNVTFSYTQSLQTQALQMGIHPLVSANIIWPAFLMITFIPYASYMLYLQYKNKKTEINYRSLSYYFATMMMGAFWFFSLIIYSAASLKIGELGSIIGWPLFMVCIILTANLWGWHHGEWKDAVLSAKRLALLSIFTLLIAIAVLALA